MAYENSCVEFLEYYFFGNKNINPIECDSEWLANYLKFLEWNREVKSYFRPNMYIPVEYGNVSVGVPIDMWVNLHDGKVYLIHFKEGGKNKPADHPDAFVQCELFCEKSNMNFQVIDQSLPEVEPRKSNINFLWKYDEREIHLGHIWLVNRFFSDNPTPNIGKFRKTLASYDFDPDLVYTFLFHHSLNADLTHFPLSDETPLTKGKISEILIEQIKPPDDSGDAS